MSPLEAYLPHKLLSRTGGLDVYDTQSDATVLLLRAQQQGAQAQALIEHLYSLLQTLAGHGTPKVVACGLIDNYACVAIKNIDGDRLVLWRRKNKPSLLDVLRLLQQLTGTLAAAHRKGLCHLGLNPSVIYINGQTLSVTLAGWVGVANLQRGFKRTVAHHHLLIPYRAPEQLLSETLIGDELSDLYSIGAVAYFLLSQQAPFQDVNLARLERKIVSQDSLALPEDVSESASVLMAIIDRLMAKEPAHRYSSAEVLLADIDVCVAALEQGEDLQDLKWGRQLSPPIPEFDKLYDFAKPFVDTKATQSLQQFILAQASEHYFYLKRCRTDVIASGGRFLTVTPFSNEVLTPFWGVNLLAQALGDQLSNEPELVSEEYRRLILTEVAEDIPFLSIVAPALKDAGLNLQTVDQDRLLLDKTGELKIDDQSNRYFRAATRFFKVLAKLYQPLVIHFKRARYLDEATLVCLKQFVPAVFKQYQLGLWCIGDDHEMPVLTEFSQTRVNFVLSSAESLPAELKQILGKTRQSKDKLGRYLSNKAKGHTERVINLLHGMVQKKALVYDHGWRWCYEKAERVTVNRSHRYNLKPLFSKLTNPQRVFLAFAAIGGRVVVFDELMALLKQSEFSTLQTIRQLVDLDLLRVSGQRVLFTSEKIMARAYELSDPAEKTAKHMLYFRFLKNRFEQHSGRTDRVLLLKMVSHGLQVKHLLSANEIVELTQQLCTCGEIYCAQGQWSSALLYLELAKNQLDKDAWKTSFDLCFRVKRLLAYVAFMAAEHVWSVALYDELFEQSLSYAQRAELADELMTLYMTRSSYRAACELGEKTLKQLDFIVESDITEQQVDALLLQCRDQLKAFGDERLEGLATSGDEKWIAQCRVANAFALASYFISGFFGVYLSAKITMLMLQRGVCSGAVFRLLGVAIYFSLRLGQHGLAVGYGVLSLRIATQKQNSRWYGRMLAAHYCLLAYWRKPLRDIYQRLIKSSQESLQVGAWYWAEEATVIAFDAQIVSGVKLASVQGHVEQVHHQAVENLQKLSAYRVPFILHLLELWRTPAVYKQHSDQLESFLEISMRDFQDLDELAIAPVLNLVETCLLFLSFQQYGQAYIAAIHVREELLKTLPGFFSEATVVAALGVSSSIMYGRGNDDFVDEYLEPLEWLRKHAAHSPRNFLHLALWVEAEVLVAQQHLESALLSYYKAMESAQQNDFCNFVGMIASRAAALCLEMNLTLQAKLLYQKAISAFNAWGAESLVEENVFRLRRLDPNYQLSGFAPASEDNVAALPQKDQLEELFDYFYALSEEVELSRVESVLFDYCTQKMGAERSVLVLFHDDLDCLRVDAESQLGYGVMRIDLELEEYLQLPHELIYECFNSQVCINIESAIEHPHYANDDWVRNNHALSLLVLPLMHQQRCSGVLLLMNNMLISAFSESDINLLQRLVKQSAIAIDRALLYSQLETRVSQRTQELLEAKEVAEKAMRARSDFLAAMSHEIRTPLNAVLGMAQILVETPLSNEQTDYVETIHSSGDALLGVINDILDFSKIEAGQLQIEFSPCSLPRILKDVGEMLAPLSQVKGVEFVVDIAPEMPSLLMADKVRLRQVLINLVNNAVKFTQQGYVKVELLLKTNDQVCVDEVLVEFKITDSGIGIRADRLDDLFEAFTQADVGTTRKYGGTGLGLHLSQQLVQAMGGVITVHSEESRGSEFSFCLQLKVVNQDDEGLERYPDFMAQVLEENSHSKKVLMQLLDKFEVKKEFDDSDVAAFRFVDFPKSASDALKLANWRQEMANTILMTPIDMRREAEKLAAHYDFELVTKPLNEWNVGGVLKRFANRSQLLTKNSSAYHPENNLFQVLLVEDNPVNQKITAAMLGKGGYRVTIVANGLLAVEAVKQQHWDVVLMDCQMPVMDGYQATREIRRWELTSANRIPIIALTANAMIEDKRRCLEVGMDDYLAKPVNMSALYELLKRYCDSVNHQGQKN